MNSYTHTYFRIYTHTYHVAVDRQTVPEADTANVIPLGLELRIEKKSSRKNCLYVSIQFWVPVGPCVFNRGYSAYRSVPGHRNWQIETAVWIFVIY